MRISTTITLILFAVSLFMVGCAERSKLKEGESRTEHNLKLVQAKVDAWKAGTGSLFDLVSERVQWTVAGTSPVSGTYNSKKDLMNKAVAPINARLNAPVKLTAAALTAQDDKVVILWQGSATAKNGEEYKNTYSWHMTIQNDSIIKVEAFLDTYVLYDLLRSLTDTTAIP